MIDTQGVERSLRVSIMSMREEKWGCDVMDLGALSTVCSSNTALEQMEHMPV